MNITFHPRSYRLRTISPDTSQSHSLLLSRTRFIPALISREGQQSQHYLRISLPSDPSSLEQRRSDAGRRTCIRPDSSPNFESSMAPSTTSPKLVAMGRNGSRLGSTSNSREVTPVAPKPVLQPSKMNKSEVGVRLMTRELINCFNTDSFIQLATVFKSDLTNIRNLVTCSICDQLLYEPWTLGCGHTYCYSVSISRSRRL
jgi:hypothetical protein